MNCPAMTSIFIPASVREIVQNPFKGCSALTTIAVDDKSSTFASYDGVLYSSGDTCLIACPGGKASVSFPPSLKRIGEEAFWGCNDLTSLVLPKGLTSIEDGAFYGLDNLKSITSLALIPPSASYDASGALWDIAKLYVQRGSLEPYKTTSPWSYFKHIAAVEEK